MVALGHALSFAVETVADGAEPASVIELVSSVPLRPASTAVARMTIAAVEASLRKVQFAQTSSVANPKGHSSTS